MTHIEIYDVIMEGQQFEDFGMNLNVVIRQAILRKEQLCENVEAVTQLVDGYNDIVEKLSSSELQFLREHLYAVESKIQAGLGRYTWQTLNIIDYTAKCLPHLKSLRSMVAQIGFTNADIRRKIYDIEQFSLFSLGTIDVNKPKETAVNYTLRAPSSALARGTGGDGQEPPKRNSKVSFAEFVADDEDKVLPCREFFHELDIDRNVKISRMNKIYDSIGPTLIKLESLILGTYTGRSEKMQQYYVYWENEIFRLFIR